MNEESHNRQKVVTVFAACIIVLILVAAVVTSKHKTAGATTAVATTTATAGAASTGASAASNASYKNGTYNATAAYQTPGGVHNITVQATLQDGVVSAVTASSDATDGDSQEYTSMFLSSYKSAVVGKSIASLNVNRLSGASLTSAVFNNAIDQIRAQAQA